MTTTMNRQRHAAHRPTEGTTASLPARGSDPASAGAGSSLWLPDGQPSPAQFAAAVILADILDRDEEVALLRIAHASPCLEAVVQECLNSEVLTAYQIDLLLEGRCQELKVGPYVVLDYLGSGGMGTVRKVRNPLLRRQEAVKILSVARASDPDAVKRFVREIRLVARLEHPGIVRAHHAGIHGDALYLAMELVSGRTLARLVRERGPLPVAEVLDYLRQVGRALRYAWESCQLVHRDIKPSNLMVTDEQRVKILDLGIGRLTAGWDEHTLTSAGELIGSLDYIAPEQITDARSVDYRADLYSLGCTGYYLLTGRVPYAAPTSEQKLLAHRAAEAEPLRSLRPAVPAPLADLIARMMAKDPKERVQSYEELDRALASIPVA